MTVRSRAETRIFDDQDALARGAAELIVASSAESIRDRRRFRVALSGGSTPQKLFSLLAEPPWVAKVDWSRCDIWWVDERAVEPIDSASNYGVAARLLLDRVSARPEQIHRVPTEGVTAHEAAVKYDEMLRAAFGLQGAPVFDLILLGLGSDGHTASLFPGRPALNETTKWAVDSPPGVLPPAVERITLTFPVLNAARLVAFLVAGADKASIVAAVLSGKSSYPATRVRPTSGIALWLLDRAAASSLPLPTPEGSGRRG